MQVKDHNKYRMFEYENDLNNENFKLGEIVIRISGRIENCINQDNGNPVGVVIQLHDDGDCRTDMFGNCSPSEVRLATLSEIMQYRENIFNDTFIKHFDKDNYIDVDNGLLYSKETFEISGHYNK